MMVMRWRAALLGAFLGASVMTQAAAQFAFVPMPLPPAAVPASQAQTPESYRVDAAKVLYASFPMLVSRDATGENLFDKALVAIDVEADGAVSEVRLLRAPTLDEAKPWILAMIKKIERFPVPAVLKQVTYTDVWLLDDTGHFRLASMAAPVAVTAVAPAASEPAAAN